MEAMTREEAMALVRNSRFGHLGLASRGRAYTLPVFYGFDGRDFYFHMRPGDKTDYLQDTEEACFTVTRVESLDDWASVMAFGPLSEVALVDEQLAAMEALMTVPLPPAWGFSRYGEPLRTDVGLRAYRLEPRRLTGRRSERPPLSEEAREMAYGGV